MPETIPVEPTVAMPGTLLPHTPPLLTSYSVTVDPLHTVESPLIADGDELTVTFAVAMQPPTLV